MSGMSIVPYGDRENENDALVELHEATAAHEVMELVIAHIRKTKPHLSEGDAKELKRQMEFYATQTRRLDKTLDGRERSARIHEIAREIGARILNFGPEMLDVTAYGPILRRADRGSRIFSGYLYPPGVPQAMMEEVLQRTREGSMERKIGVVLVEDMGQRFTRESLRERVAQRFEIPLDQVKIEEKHLRAFSGDRQDSPFTMSVELKDFCLGAKQSWLIELDRKATGGPDLSKRQNPIINRGGFEIIGKVNSAVFKTITIVPEPAPVQPKAPTQTHL